MNDPQSRPLARLFRALFKCALPICVVALVFKVGASASTWHLDQLRVFSPVTLLNLYQDSAVECAENSPSADGAQSMSQPRSGAGREALIGFDTNDRLSRLMTSDLLARLPCRTTPIIGDWPRVGHWAAGWPLMPAILIAPVDIAWHLVVVAAFKGQIVPAVLCAIEIVVGFAISYLIARKLFDDAAPNEYLELLYFLTGTLVFGVLSIWIMMNLVAFLYDALTPIFPKAQDAGTAAIVTFLSGQCVSLGLLFKRLSDRTTDLLGDKTAELVERK